MPTLMSFPTIRRGNSNRNSNTNKNKGTTAIVRKDSNCQPSPKRWYHLLEEHDQSMQEVEEAFQNWLNRRHQKTVQESKRWEEAHNKTTQELKDTKMELASTKKRLNILQQQVSPSRSSSKNREGNEKRCPTDVPSVVVSYDDDYSLERDASDVSRCEQRYPDDDFQTADRNRQMLQELKSNMESYQVILRWQERQTGQWRSRCNGQLSQIEGLLATVEQQRIELQLEKEQCDVLIDAVYDLVHEQQKDNPVVVDENTEVENSTQEVRSAYPDDCCCPLTQQLFVDPVIDYEGNTYEKKAILEWLEEYNQTSPITRSPLRKDQLIPNRAVKYAIAVWDKR